MRLFVIARHGQSTFNIEKRVNGRFTTQVDLTEQGREEARLMGEQLTNLPFDLVVHTRFSRTRETARIALGDRPCEYVEEPLLDDIDVGDLDGKPIEEYRAWKRAHTRRDRFPGGESLDEAAIRYAEAYRRMLARPERVALVVCHEIPLRYALNGAAGSDSLDGPIHSLRNASPYLFSDEALERAVERIDALARAPARA